MGTATDKFTSVNSFYHLGDIDILTFQQDELSKLWKFYLSTPEHYVVSREFDKSHGLYADAPEEIIRRGLMDFSASILGGQLSIFAIMDMFIDRCFDDSVFDQYTTNAIWLCLDNPSYSEVEDILVSYGSRIIWARSENDGKYPAIGDYVNRILFRTPERGKGRSEIVDAMRSEFKDCGVTSIFLNNDSVIEDVLTDSGFDDFPIFLGQFDGNGEFTSFKYIGH